MDLREKLIEILRKPIFPHELVDPIEAVADYLLDNGVTIGKPLEEYLHPIDDYAGLKGKYLVFKADTGERIANCFVLRPGKDTAAVEALRTYANATENKTLANDICNWVGKDNNVPCKWIPVSERLPTEEDALLERSVYAYTKAKKVLILNYQYVHRRSDYILYWMPISLPEPPKGE